MATTVIEDKLAAWLAAHPDLNPIHGGRVYPFNGVPQNTAWPFLAYWRVSGGRVRSLAGPSGVSHPRLQLDCFGLKYADAKRLAGAVREALRAIRGDVGGLNVQVAVDDDDRDEAASPIHGDEVTQFRITVEVCVWFNER
jgi:hypothetical protein